MLWQIQPVHIDWDNDPDWAVPPIVADVSCGTLAMTVQKDGYLHAAGVKGAPHSDPACSYPTTAGNAIVTTNGGREEHAAGDIWVVPINARVVIEASAETTVLRAMYFVKE